MGYRMIPPPVRPLPTLLEDVLVYRLRQDVDEGMRQLMHAPDVCVSMLSQGPVTDEEEEQWTFEERVGWDSLTKLEWAVAMRLVRSRPPAPVPLPSEYMTLWK